MTQTIMKYSSVLFLLAVLLLPGVAHAQEGSECEHFCYTWASYDPNANEITGYSLYQEATCGLYLGVDTWLEDPNAIEHWMGWDEGYCQVEVDYSYTPGMDGGWQASGNNYNSPEDEWFGDGQSWCDVGVYAQTPTGLEITAETDVPFGPCAWNQNYPYQLTECGFYRLLTYQVLDQYGVPIHRMMDLSDSISTSGYDSCNLDSNFELTPPGEQTGGDGTFTDTLGACTGACCTAGVCTTGCYSDAWQYWYLDNSAISLELWFYCDAVNIYF